MLVRYADRTLDAQELSRLEAELKTNSEARVRLRDLAEQAFAIGEAGRCREARMPMRRIAEFPTVGHRRRWRGALAWSAAAVAMAGVLFFVQTRARNSVLEIVSVRGAAVWSNAGKRVALVSGLRLPSGTIETESETATVEVRLADGSHFTLDGPAEAVFSERDGKRVTLNRGRLTASVARQSAGQQLRVRTPAADLEVLGTVFALEAALQRTNLSVAEGRVRLRRLVDGREVEVAAEQQVAASLLATEALVPEGIKVPPSAWTLPLTTEPERLSGTWIAADSVDPPRIASVPIVEKRQDDGRVYVHHGLIVRSASNSPGDAFAAVTADSVLRIRLRMKRKFSLQLMIATRRPDGAFAGNFELVKLHPHLVAGSEWQTLEVALRDFSPIHPERAKVAAGNQANVVILTTLHEPVGVEVAEISILPAPTLQ